MKVLSRVLFVVFLIHSPVLPAEEVKRLYETEILVRSDHEEDRRISTKEALKTLLTRILVGKNILENKAVKNVLANATYYVREYQYSLGSAGTNNSRLMRVLFDEHKVVNTFRAANMGIWNEIRPRTLLWLVIENQNKQQFFDASLMPEIDLALAKSSKQKKLPLLLPILDLNENRKLSISDVLSAYSDHLLESSARYDVVSTLAGKIVNKGECWKAEWTFYFDSKIKQWSSSCGTINDITLHGFQGVYEKLAAYYAVIPETGKINSISLKANDMQKKEKISNFIEPRMLVK